MKHYGKQYHCGENYLKFLSKYTETTGERKKEGWKKGGRDIATLMCVL